MVDQQKPRSRNPEREPWDAGPPKAVSNPYVGVAGGAGLGSLIFGVILVGVGRPGPAFGAATWGLVFVGLGIQLLLLALLVLALQWKPPGNGGGR